MKIKVWDTEKKEWNKKCFISPLNGYCYEILKIKRNTIILKNNANLNLRIKNI